MEGLSYRNQLAVMHYNENVLARLKAGKCGSEPRRRVHSKALKKEIFKKIRTRAPQDWKTEIRRAALDLRRNDTRTITSILQLQKQAMALSAVEEEEVLVDVEGELVGPLMAEEDYDSDMSEEL